MSNLAGLKIAICQMSVVPGKPDFNAAYIMGEIKKASERGMDIIAFPEMCTTGYFIGDLLEDAAFLQDVFFWNKRIVQATKGLHITVLFGTVTSSQGMRGEDGRPRIHNTALAAYDGKVMFHTIKSLQPNYRMFNDNKHLYSMRKMADEARQAARAKRVPAEKLPELEDFLNPFMITTRLGGISLGVILCEDMWHEDYPYNPAKVLATKGAHIIFNLSASPWTWQKNRKRHQIVKRLSQDLGVPFVYVNNTGAQNTGKNIIVFDGSSTAYNQQGDIVCEVSPYVQGAHDMAFEDTMPIATSRPQDDTKELYSAMVCATKSIVPPDVQVVVGLSGGVDSAVVAAHLVDVLGPERVVAVNMPMMSLSSSATQEMARTIAQNAGIPYEVHAIDEFVGAMCRHAGIKPGTLQHENAQARARMTMLAALASQYGGVFTCNMNKTEAAFGYGTLHGDIAGFYAPLGDMVKREVRQIAQYLNEVRFGREVIPEQCIRQIPTAELAPGQKDPFHYGDEYRRGYHDEMIRAFMEFRKDPEWFLEVYLQKKLEEELLLEEGTLARLFATPREFIADLEWCWRMFGNSFFKRVQCPPIPIFSKRAFGRDLEESMMAPHFTERYKAIKRHLCAQDARSRRHIAVFGTSANPPSANHRMIIEKLARVFDRVIVVPCGMRGDKQSVGAVSPFHRKEMARRAFAGIPHVELDMHDLEQGVFTPTCALYARYRMRFPNAELWFAVGPDIIEGGARNKSEIHRVWKKGHEIWGRLNFAVLHSGSAAHIAHDVPPFSQLVKTRDTAVRSTVVREYCARGENIKGLVHPSVACYIEERNLYKA